MWWALPNEPIREGEMTSTYTELSALCELLGFDLYPKSGDLNEVQPMPESEWVKRAAIAKYKNVLFEEK